MQALKVKTLTVFTILTCPGKLCRGLYGAEKGVCPCVQVCKRPRHALMLHVAPGAQTEMDTAEDASLLETVSLLLFEPYVSTELTDLFIDTTLLEVCNKQTFRVAGEVIFVRYILHSVINSCG